MEGLDYILHTTPIGALGLGCTGGRLSRVWFLGAREGQDLPLPPEPVLRQTVDELQAYFAGQLKRFTIPLAPSGSAFQLQVWEALCAIPWGETRSYKDIALALDNLGAIRAVGMACNRNPLPLIIPCHRVIGSSGELVGFGGGLPLKRQLLEHERILPVQRELF
ncbi:MAG: methylated-DNA--[protein]-cysteine S-methyltransferase [Verrucomicrobiota bacterium JB022]|nr:methylated-DNA--[protein]-cysteine S-methyltransferase [Verrucomicrobiota bacterium JB022]